MFINTTNFGKIEIDDNKIINFTETILGFEEYSRFTIIDNLEDDIFYWLQSVDEPNLSFIMINPSEFINEYNISFSQKIQQRLGLKKDSDMVIYTIVVIEQLTGNIRTNLKAPIIINAENNKAGQVILDEDYPTQYYLFKSDTTVEEIG